MNSQDSACFCQEPPMMRHEQGMGSLTETLIYESFDGTRYKKAKMPIRFFIFVLTLMVFIIGIYHIAFSDYPPLSATLLRPIIVLAFAYVIFDLFHIIGYFYSTDIVDCPMIIGSFIAFHLFAIAGVALAWTTGLVASSWPVLFMYFECFSISFLHAADVLLAIGYWRHRNSYRPKFDPPPDEMTINSAGNDGDI